MKSDIWRNRDYRLWFWSDSLAQVGRSFGAFCFPLLVILETGSTILAGTIQSVSTLAGAILLVPAGALADSVNRRKGSICFALIYAAAMIALVMLVYFDLLRTELFVVFAIALAAIATPLNLCVDAMLKTLLPPEHLPEASAAEEVRGSILSITVPPIAAAALTAARTLPFLASAIGALIAAFAAFRIGDRETFQPKITGKRRSKPYSGWADGFSILYRTPALFALLGLSMALNVAFTGVNTALLYAWIEREQAAPLVGLIAAASSVGSVIGGLSASRIIRGRKGKTVIRTAVCASTIALCLIPFCPNEFSTLLALGLASLPLPWFNAVLGGLMVATIPNEAQGRVGAAAQVIALAVTPIVPIVTGIALKLLSLPATLLVFTTVGLLGAITCFALPAIGSIGRPSEWREGAYGR